MVWWEVSVFALSALRWCIPLPNWFTWKNLVRSLLKNNSVIFGGGGGGGGGGVITIGVTICVFIDFLVVSCVWLASVNRELKTADVGGCTPQPTQIRGIWIFMSGIWVPGGISLVSALLYLASLEDGHRNPGCLKSIGIDTNICEGRLFHWYMGNNIVI